MAYVKKTYVMRETIEIEKYHNGRYGAPGEKRIKKKKATPEQVKRQNLWQAIKKLRRKINANFGVDDLHCTLTYNRENRAAAREAKRILVKFLRSLKKEYKKAGYELKYIITTEYENKAIHHHMIVNAIPETVKLIRLLWQQGRPYFVPLDDAGDYGKLAEYFVKETEKTFKDPSNPNKLRYSCSRNLITPEAKKEIITAATFRKDPAPVKGYYIDKNSIHTGINPVTGYQYQSYTMIRIKERGEKGG